MARSDNDELEEGEEEVEEDDDEQGGEEKMLGFIFGNVDEAGELEEEYMDEVRL